MKRILGNSLVASAEQAVINAKCAPADSPQRMQAVEPPADLKGKIREKIKHEEIETSTLPKESELKAEVAEDKTVKKITTLKKGETLLGLRLSCFL